MADAAAGEVAVAAAAAAEKAAAAAASGMVAVSRRPLESKLANILVGLGLAPPKAELIAGIFASSSADGVHSHGMNRWEGAATPRNN